MLEYDQGGCHVKGTCGATSPEIMKCDMSWQNLTEHMQSLNASRHMSLSKEQHTLKEGPGKEERPWNEEQHVI